MKRTTTKTPDKDGKLQPEKINELKTNAMSSAIDTTPKKTDEEDLMKSFETFEKTNADFKPEITEEQISVDSKGENNNTDITNTIGLQIKTKMFVGMCCFLLTGLNTFLFNKIRNTKVPMNLMVLDDTELDSIMPYMDSPEIAEFINKIPTGIMAFIHIEYMYFNKHSIHASEYKKEIETKE